MSEKNSNIALFTTGLFLILLPLFFVVVFPDKIEKVELYLRLVASLGGALIGAWIPGMLHINLPGIRAGGALAILVLFYQFNPPQVLNNVLGPEKEPVIIPTPEPISVSAPEVSLAPVCSFVSIQSLNWSSGHKTNFCKSNGYEKGNFNQGDYSNGGICMTGSHPEVCKAKVTGLLSSSYRCETEGRLTKCYEIKQPPQKVVKNFVRSFNFENHSCGTNEDVKVERCVDDGYFLSGIVGEPFDLDTDSCGSRFISFQKKNETCGDINVHLQGCGFTSIRTCKGHAKYIGKLKLAGYKDA